LAAGSPRVLENMEKVMELVEVFEKEPDLYNKMRAMIEGTR